MGGEKGGIMSVAPLESLVLLQEVRFRAFVSPGSTLVYTGSHMRVFHEVLRILTSSSEIVGCPNRANFLVNPCEIL